MRDFTRRMPSSSSIKKSALLNPVFKEN